MGCSDAAETPMPIKPRPRREPTDNWQQLALWVEDPAQRVYEVMRPCVLFGQSPAERARQTGVPQRTLYRQVERFDTLGMRSLFAPVEKDRTPRPTLSPHQPRQLSSGQAPRIGPNTLRPRIQAPILVVPRATKSSSMPSSPASLPCISANERVGKIHSCRASPPTPSGLSRS